MNENRAATAAHDRFWDTGLMPHESSRKPRPDPYYEAPQLPANRLPCPDCGELMPRRPCHSPHYCEACDRLHLSLKWREQDG